MGLQLKMPFHAIGCREVTQGGAAFLDRQSSQRAIHQYLHILVGQAEIEGLVLEGADSPLVQ